MSDYKVVYHRNALKDAANLENNGTLKKKVKDLIDIVTNDPYQNPPPYKHLVGNLKGLISRRINIQHRLVYEVREQEKTVVIMRMWSHYE